jgi:hypothetical protein
VEHVIGILRAVAPFEVAQGAERPRDEDRRARDIPRLPGELHAGLDDLFQAIVEQFRGEFAPVGAEGVRLDQLGARPDEAEVHLDDRLRGLEVGFLGTPQARDRRCEERARAAVGDDHRPIAQPFQCPAHVDERTDVLRQCEENGSLQIVAGVPAGYAAGYAP